MEGQESKFYKELKVRRPLSRAPFAYLGRASQVLTIASLVIRNHRLPILSS